MPAPKDFPANLGGLVNEDPDQAAESPEVVAMMRQFIADRLGATLARMQDDWSVPDVIAGDLAEEAAQHVESEGHQLADWSETVGAATLLVREALDALESVITRFRKGEPLA